MTKTDDLNALHEQLLRDSSGGECLSLAHVDHVAQCVAPDSLRVRQELVVDTLRLLLNDGLIVVGHIVGGSDERLDPWDMSLDDAMARIYDEYVLHHDDRNWVFRTWFQLTERGEQVAKALETPDSAD